MASIVKGRVARAEGMGELILHMWQSLSIHPSPNPEKEPVEMKRDACSSALSKTQLL